MARFMINTFLTKFYLTAHEAEQFEKRHQIDLLQTVYSLVFVQPDQAFTHDWKKEAKTRDLGIGKRD